METGTRLNKFLAMCGVGARRKVEELIAEGRVRVDGKVVLLPGYRVLSEMEVVVDNKVVKPQTQRYLVINKPAGVVCAVEDEHATTILEILPPEFQNVRLFPVGRLDKESEGLLILTNDGGFAQEVIHPSARILREYEVMLDRAIARKDVRKWMAGITLDNRLLKPLNVLILDREPQGCWVSVVLSEGIKREVRRMAAEIGFEVVVLVRKRIGKMELDKLPKGHFVEMSRGELRYAIRSGRVV